MSNARRLGAWWPALVVAAAIAWQFRAPLVGRVYWFGEIANYFHPLYTAAARNMRFGFLPSWDLGAWAGQPLVGDPRLGALYPPNWLWLWVRPMRLYAWLQLAHAAWAAGGMFALARLRGRSREAAAVAALALGAGAFVVLATEDASLVATTAWLPWVLWGVERYAKTRHIDHLLTTSMAFALAILAGGWPVLIFGAPQCAVYAIARILDGDPSSALEPEKKHDRAISRRRLAIGLGAAAAIGLALAAAQIFPALAHWRESPRALGLDYDVAARGAWPSWRYLATLLFPKLYGHGGEAWELRAYSIGALATLLVPFAFWRRERRREHQALLLCCIAAIFFARGAGGGLHPLLFRLPVVGALSRPALALYVWALAMPLLAADGLDALTERLRRPPWRALVPRLAVIAIALELLITWRAANPSTTLAATQERPAAAAFLTSRGRPGRMVTDPNLGARFRNTGLLWNFESAVGDSALPLWRYRHLLYIASHGAVYPHARLGGELDGEGLARYSSPLVDLLAVSWVIAPHDRPPDGSGYELAFAGDDGVDVWRNREAYPRGFVVYRAHVAASDDEAARAVADEKFRPGRVAVVPRAIAGVPEPSPGEKVPLPTPIHALSRESSLDLAVDVNARAPGVLVLGEPWSPSWSVTVDGKAAELLRADYALRGVALTAGEHVVAMRCDDRPLVYGGLVSLAALALVIALSWFLRTRPANVRSS